MANHFVVAPDVPSPPERICVRHGKPISPSAWAAGCRLSGCHRCRVEGKDPSYKRFVNLELRKQNGNQAVESGQLLAAAKLGGVKQGPITGKIAVESGQLLKAASVGGRVAGHLRWHEARGIFKPEKCALCAGATAAELYEQLK